MRFNIDALTLRYLKRLGGAYIPFTVILVQLLAFITGPSILIAQNNARFLPDQVAQAMLLSGVMALFGILVAGVWGWLDSRSARAQLDQWRTTGTAASNPDQETRAWRNINSITLRFVPCSLLVFLVGQFAVISAYLFFVYHISWTQIIYILFATLATAIGGTALAVLLLEVLLRPARQVLLPAKFESQLQGAARFSLSLKLFGIAGALTFLSLLLVGPIGYRHTLLAASAAEAPAQTLLSFQIQSLLTTAILILIGFMLAFLIVRALNEPLKAMIRTFQMIETGDLKQRVNLTTTDEIGELSIYFNHMVERLATLQESIETQVRERTAQLSATVQVANAISAILNSDELIERVVNLIAGQFDYYYVALFLIDSTGKWAELRAATGDAGRVLRANNHRLEIGSRSMVGRAIHTREVVVAMSTAEDHIRFDNPLLPYTRSEIALPLMVGDRILGALDAQSTREGEFGPEDIEILKTMANQVSVALENARSFQAAQQALQDMNTIQRQYLMTSWKGFTDEKGPLDYAIGEAEPGETITELEIPLTLRDQVIGGIEVSGTRDWTPEEKNMIEAIATQAALALENARLVEESQSSARREHLVAEITGKIWTSPTVDAILQTAARELGRALESDEVTIELKVDEQ